MNIGIKAIALHALFITGLVFLFVGGPGHNIPRYVGAGWNLGHVALFILFIFILNRDWKGFSAKPLKLQWVLVISVSALFALTTELMQSYVGRQFDVFDIFRDLAGCVIGMLLLGKLSDNYKRRGNAVRVSVIVSLLIITSYQLAISLTDEYIAAKQFPVLAGFETPFEINRWRADGAISISNDISKSGNSSLKAVFTTKAYSNVTIKYSLGKWEKYKSLKFSIFNPDSAALKIECRINDRKHNNRYKDRLNRNYLLKRGWNTLTISLDDLRNAPSGRKMDLNSISSISFFTMSLPAPRTVYFDDIYLVK